MSSKPEVTELRLVVTAPDYEQALQFYRDVLGLSERAAYTSPGGRVTILEAGRATCFGLLSEASYLAAIASARGYCSALKEMDKEFSNSP